MLDQRKDGELASASDRKNGREEQASDLNQAAMLDQDKDADRKNVREEEQASDLNHTAMLEEDKDGELASDSDQKYVREQASDQPWQ